MNIETLNQWGGNCLDFAWAMLWQSSLLIIIVFALDFLLAKKIRASVRYALWLVVLTKLILPPGLALPTSPVWWYKASPAIIKQPTAHFTVTYGNAPLPQIPQNPPPVFTPPKPAMTVAAWLLMLSASVSVVLLAWLLARWWQISRKVRRAANSSRLTAIAREAQKVLGLKSKVQVRLATNPMSPAVCGLFRPAILIPQPLADNFSDEQLRAVLLHETIHLRRGDVWVNCAQTLLQIFYWWHPLLWLANARIRRVREEAVDDAVMLALDADTDIYAPTLLEVAKLAFRRPLASLGLVGILESRSALRQRIERLMNFSKPRKAGITFLSLCGIFLFSAVALPMGSGPASDENQPDLASPKTSSAPEKTLPKTVLITSHFYWVDNVNLKKVISALKSDSSGDDSSWPISPEKLNRVTDDLQNMGLSGFAAPRVATINHETATISITSVTNGIVLTCTPNITNELVHLAIHGTVNKDSTHLQFTGNRILTNSGGIVILTKNVGAPVESNLLALVSFQIISPTNFLKKISQGNDEQLTQDGKLLYESGRLDEAKAKLQTALKLNSDNATAQYYLNLVEKAQSAPKSGGVKFIHPTLRGTVASRRGIINRLQNIRLKEFGCDAAPLEAVQKNLTEAIGEQDAQKLGVGFIQSPDLNSVLVTISPALTNVLAQDALEAIVAGASKPIKYSIHDDGVEFSWKNQTSPTLYSRTFKLNTNAFFAGLRRQAGVKYDPTEMISSIRQLFTNAGVDLSPPKAIFYNDELGLLFVRATTSDLDTVERILEPMNMDDGPQVHIKARFIEVTQDHSKTSGTDWYLGHFNVSNNVVVKGGSAPSPVVSGAAVNPMGNFPGNMTSNAVGSSNPAHAAGQITGILTDTNFRVVLHALEQRGGVEILGEPEGTTISGRQMQMRVTRIFYVATNLTFQGNTTNSAIVPQREKVETGPVLDTVASVFADGYTIDLDVTASLTEFSGYGQNDEPVATVKSNDNNTSVPSVSPDIRVWKATAHIHLYDGQTLIVSKFIGPGDLAKSNDRELLVFVTVNLVDSAGNRLHSDSEMPFAQNGIPPQN